MEKYTKMIKAEYEVWTYEEIVKLFEIESVNLNGYDVLNLPSPELIDELYKEPDGRIYFDDWDTKTSDWKEVELTKGQFLVIFGNCMSVVDNLQGFEKVK
jgi:hypothetical protein